MDKLYTGDIPDTYKYALYGDNYIDLFSTDNINGNLDFYRVYMYDNYFTYDHLFQNFTDTKIASIIETTNDWYYRRDMPSIMFMSVVEVCILIILFNIITSVFKKGGLLHGLL